MLQCKWLILLDILVVGDNLKGFLYILVVAKLLICKAYEHFERFGDISGFNDHC